MSPPRTPSSLSAWSPPCRLAAGMDDRLTILPPPPSARVLARAAAMRCVRRWWRGWIRSGLRALAILRRAGQRGIARARAAAQAIAAAVESSTGAPREPGPVLPGGERVSALVTRLLAEQAARAERPTRTEVRRGAVPSS